MEMTSGEQTRLLVLTGSMGAGKSTVMVEASDLLIERGIAHAAIDVDALGIGFLNPSASTDGVSFQNLRSVCGNYSIAGVRRFIVACALESRKDLERVCAAVPASDVAVCRLSAPIEVLEMRVRAREIGMKQQELVARASVLDAILDRAAVENFAVANSRRAITEVALDVLARARWI